jgi:hypothetical protein
MGFEIFLASQDGPPLFWKTFTTGPLDAWGTPLRIFGAEKYFVQSYTFLHWILFDKYDLNHFSSTPFMP